MLVFFIKKILGNFALFILRILELFAYQVCKLIKNKANFYLALLFLNVYKQTLHVSHVPISQNVKDCLM